ncbi:MAG: hypothetical protein MUD12_06975 [Spirochaetes bacterium]|jgi:hypothetical protein|nr:hypothetical protein [Spirochaetota bacterium]
MKKIQASFIIIIALLIALIDLQTKFHFIKEPKLWGVFVPVVIPNPGPENIFSGAFQKTFEKWLADNAGLRSFFIKSRNQLYVWFYREISLNFHERVILGRENYLYQYPYVFSHNRLDIIPEKVIEEKVKKIKALQEFMKKKNRALIFCITPSKATIYPEYIPDRYVNKERLKIKSNYDVLIPLLEKHGVVYADGRRLFLNLKSEKWPLFPKSGAHWNYYSAFMFLSKINEKLKTLSNKSLNLSDLKLKGVRVADKPEIFVGLSTEDDDLAHVINVYDPSFSYGNYAYPDIPRPTTVKKNRPRILIVGGSFNRQLIDLMFRYGLYDQMDLFYYYSKIQTLPASFIDDSKPIDKSKLDWEKDIFSKDIIFIETNEEAISKMGRGFIEDAYKNAMR